MWRFGANSGGNRGDDTGILVQDGGGGGGGHEPIRTVEDESLLTTTAMMMTPSQQVVTRRILKKEKKARFRDGLIWVWFCGTVFNGFFAGIMTATYGDLYKDGVTSEDYFSSFEKSLYTCYQMMTLDNWSNISREVLSSRPWAWLLFVPFVAFASLILYQGLTVVLCDSVLSVETQQLRGELQAIRDRQANMEEKLDKILALLSSSTTSSSPSDAAENQKVGLVV